MKSLDSEYSHLFFRNNLSPEQLILRNTLYHAFKNGYIPNNTKIIFNKITNTFEIRSFTKNKVDWVSPPIKYTPTQYKIWMDSYKNYISSTSLINNDNIRHTSHIPIQTTSLPITRQPTTFKPTDSQIKIPQNMTDQPTSHAQTTIIVPPLITNSKNNANNLTPIIPISSIIPISTEQQLQPS